MTAETPRLNGLLAAIADGSIKMIDLTETLRPEYPTIQLPEEFGQAWAFKKEEISMYDDRGPMWTWSNFSMSEHTGTHLDAPRSRICEAIFFAISLSSFSSFSK